MYILTAHIGYRTSMTYELYYRWRLKSKLNAYYLSSRISFDILFQEVLDFTNVGPDINVNL